jgi:hypothetical protein
VKAGRRNRLTTRTLVTIAATLEVAAGSALIVNPNFVVHWLVGSSLSSGGIAVGRVGGFGLLSLGLACWPSGEVLTTQATAALFIFNLFSALYIGDLGVYGGFAGYLLWPTFVLRALLAILLALPAYEALRREWLGFQVQRLERYSQRAVFRREEKTEAASTATQARPQYLENTHKRLAKETT